MEYDINYTSLGGIIPIPNQLFDYIKEFSSDYLKILTFILGSKNKPTIEDISEYLSINIDIVKDSIRYWDYKGILVLINTSSKKPAHLAKPNSSLITADELIDAKNNDENAAMLFDQAELLYNRPLKPSERRNLLFILDTTNLPVDVILMVVDFCIRIGKSSSRYILAVCDNWDDLDINTHEKAENQIRYLTEKNDYEHLICACFGIHNRKLSSNESKSIDKWLREYKFPVNIIQVAYNRCIDSTGKLSFPYINKILSSWHKSGLNSIEKIEEYENKYKKDNRVTYKKDYHVKKEKSENAPSYDIEEFAKRGFIIKE